MSQFHGRFWIVHVLVLACLWCSRAIAAVPAVELVLTEPVGIAWRAELIQYPLTFPAGAWSGPATLTVTDDQGQTLTHQITDLRRHADGSIAALTLWLQVDLQANQSRRFTVKPGTPNTSTEKSETSHALRAQQDTQEIELLTDAPQRVGIRVLSGQREFTPAIPASQAPGPIRSLLLPSGRSVGRGQIQAPFQVKSYQATLDHTGPLFAQATVRYMLEQGYWIMKARVIRGCPMILIDEEFDTGTSGQTWENIDRFYQLNLSQAMNGGSFSPTQGFYTGRTDKDEYRDLLREHVPARLKDGGTLEKSTGIQVSGYTLKPTSKDTDYFLMPWPTWSPRVGGFHRYVEPNGDAIGIATLTLEGWRNPLALRLSMRPDGATLNLPLQVYSQGWNTEGFGNPSPNYTGRTLGVPATTARRSYGLMLTRAEDELKAPLQSLLSTAINLSTHPLNEVKNWTLDWRDPLASAAWSPTPTDAGEQVIKLMRDWVDLRRETGNFGVFSMWTYYSLTKRGRYEAAQKIIDDPAQLSAAQRKTLRSLLAYQAYVLNSVEVFPWGIGPHLGNPNMSIMCMDARVKASMLVKDHPLYKIWGQQTVDFCKLYIERFTRDTGAPFENCHYTLAVTIPELAQVNQSMRDAGLGDFFDTPRFKAFARFILDWSAPPDPRFLNHRMITSFGNGSSYMSMPVPTARFLVDYYKESDPKLASQLQWFTNQTLPEKGQLKIVTDAAPALTSVHHQDYGVIFRHGFGTPHETFLHLLAGNCEGHYEWETEQMAYTLYAKGQPINLHFGNGYHPMLNRPWLRNRISIDHLREINERHDAKILRTDLAPEADYVHASKSFDQLRALATEYPVLDKPKGIVNRDVEPPQSPIQTIPLVTWHRQIMFLKDADPAGPNNYFVLRETFADQPTRPTDLNFWFLANTMTRSGDTFSFDGQCKVDMDVFVHTPASSEPTTDRYGHSQHPYRRAVGFDPAFHPDGVLQETQLLLRLKQPSGAGYLVVLYPRLKNIDSPAQFARLGPSVVQVTTSLSKDYVFLDSAPITFEDDTLKFTGSAAAVRFYPDGRIVIVNQQGPMTLRVAGKSITGSEGFTITLKDDKIVDQQLRDGGKAYVSW